MSIVPKCPTCGTANLEVCSDGFHHLTPSDYLNLEWGVPGPTGNRKERRAALSKARRAKEEQR